MPEDTRYGFPLPAWEAAKAQANAFIQQRARERRTLTYAELCREVTVWTMVHSCTRKMQVISGLPQSLLLDGHTIDF